MRNKVVLISGMQIQVKWKNKLFELFCGPNLNYDSNDDKHVYKNNSHDDDDIFHYGTGIDYKTTIIMITTCDIETKGQRNIFEVLVFYFQRLLSILYPIWINCQSSLLNSR